MEYSLTHSSLIGASKKLKENAAELKRIANQMSIVIAQLAASNKALEIAEFKDIYNGNACKDILRLSDTVDDYSNRLAAIHNLYYQGQCNSIRFALQALNKL